MLSVNLISRLFHTAQHGRLLDRIVHNGLEAPLPLRIRLEQSPASAIALGLRRLSQLTYRPTALSTEMVEDLLARQDGRGMIDNDLTASVATTAALHATRRQTGPGLTRDRIETALHRGVAAIALCQHGDGLLADETDRTLEDRALTTAFALYLLSECEPFRTTVRFAEMLSWFEDRVARLDDATQRLWLMARTDATSAGRPAVAAAA